MEGKTDEEVERYAKVFKERYKELNGNVTANLSVTVKQAFVLCLNIGVRIFSQIQIIFYLQIFR